MEERAEVAKQAHDEVVAENQQKVADYMEKCNAAVAEVAGDREEISLDEAIAATDNIPQPELETPPRRTRKERQSVGSNDSEPDTTQQKSDEDVMTQPESGRRTRRTKVQLTEQTQTDSESSQNDTSEQESETRTRRTRRTRS